MVVTKSKRNKSSVQDKVLTVNTEATMKSTSIRTEPVDVGTLVELPTNSETTKHVKTVRALFLELCKSIRLTDC